MNTQKPVDVYNDLMSTIKHRFDLIWKFGEQKGHDSFIDEIAAYQGRKILEGIAFGCLVAVENGFKYVPKDAKRQYKADKIFSSLNRKDILVLPSPSEIRSATEDEIKTSRVTAIISEIPDRRINCDQLCKIYSRLNKWAHELNPYVKAGREAFINSH